MVFYTAAMLIHPTLRMQSWGFVVGAFLFALGSAPVVSRHLGVAGANTSFFVGSWFFTCAAFVQLMLSGSPTIADKRGMGIRAEWLAALIQFVGTLLFNVSTGAALHTHTVAGEMHLVWNPNLEGSLCFLASSALAVLMLWRDGSRWAPRSRDWQSCWLNMLGSIAFGVSAAGAFVLSDGNTLDPNLANVATFVGALCFLAAAALFVGARPGLRSAAPAT